MSAAVSRQLAIPISTLPDLAQIEAVRPLLEGKRCAIVGSAPLPTMKADILPDEIVIPVNGGISSTSGVVPLWVVGSKTSDAATPHRKPLHSAMLSQCGGRSVGHILLLRGPKVATEQLTLSVLESLRCTYQSWSVLDKPTKRWLERQLCGRVDDNQPCSSGILAAAIACYCGALMVRLVGVSLKPGYHYLPKDRPQTWWRDHIEADRRAIQIMRQHYAMDGELLRSLGA